jgi:hypothetical protein
MRVVLGFILTSYQSEQIIIGRRVSRVACSRHRRSVRMEHPLGCPENGARLRNTGCPHPFVPVSVRVFVQIFILPRRVSNRDSGLEGRV